MRKEDFPLAQKYAYLDSAATSLTPKEVLDAMNEYYQDYNSNVHRGVHRLAEDASVAYETARRKISGFIGAREEEIVFTSGATLGLNMLARWLSRREYPERDSPGKVVVTEMEHHANIVPWQKLGFEVEFAPVLEDGTVDMDELREMAEGAIAVSACHISNVLGTVNPVKEMAGIAHEAGALMIVDGAQSVPHMPVDVKELGADFIAFSGHKMLGPTGIGALYGKKELLEEVEPLLYGGGMIKEVSKEETTLGDLPARLEGGTPNIAGAVGLGAAVDYLNNIGMQKVEKHGRKLARAAVDALEEKGIPVYGPPGEKRSALASFNLKGIHPHDVSQVLDEEDVMIRAGHHCAMPLHRKLGISASCRASFYVYNEEEDVQRLMSGLEKAREVFRRL